MNSLKNIPPSCFPKSQRRRSAKPPSSPPFSAASVVALPDSIAFCLNSFYLDSSSFACQTGAETVTWRDAESLLKASIFGYRNRMFRHLKAAFKTISNITKPTIPTNIHQHD
ncbi:hypothetical protein AAHA92_28915 [Salvia divinorum]|uniref:Uncharacterized protein n=1 Tax=Salvia divinorum TaxID=28513 RepID=A0ABD1FWM5_SALDI